MVCKHYGNNFVYSLKNIMQKEFQSKNHSKFLIKYHIIFVCKYRRQVLKNVVLDESVKQVLFDIANESDFNIEVMETDKDHVHILVSSIPRLSPLQIVRKFKQESTYRIWKLHSDILRRIYWKEHTLWTDGFFVSTIGNVSQETVKHYIENQG